MPVSDNKMAICLLLEEGSPFLAERPHKRNNSEKFLTERWKNMVLFLTSSPMGPLDNSWEVNGIEEKNGFADRLRQYWKPDARCLVISAFPADAASNDEMQNGMADNVKRGGFSISAFDVWDDRTEDYSKETLDSYDVVFLGGGHVPTQNEFFHRIGLREKIRDFEGIIIGISAGTMNSAEMVYAQPELEGEAVDPDYVRFLQGLGLTNANILPHYQMVKDQWLDGMRLFEDITYGDSHRQEFLALPDGSYLLAENGTETVYGEAYLIADGIIRKICEENESIKYFRP